MLFQDVLFRVPIYRESQDAYYEDLTEQRDRFVEKAIERDPTSEQWWRENPPQINLERISWDYNRIIGWIEFYASGRKIKAHLWFTRAQRVRKQFGRVIFDPHFGIGDVTANYDHDNDSLRRKIREFLASLQKGDGGWGFDRFYIDSSLLLLNLEYMDDLLEEHL